LFTSRLSFPGVILILASVFAPRFFWRLLVREARPVSDFHETALGLPRLPVSAASAPPARSRFVSALGLLLPKFSPEGAAPPPVVRSVFISVSRAPPLSLCVFIPFAPPVLRVFSPEARRGSRVLASSDAAPSSVTSLPKKSFHHSVLFAAPEAFSRVMCRRPSGLGLRCRVLLALVFAPLPCIGSREVGFHAAAFWTGFSRSAPPGRVLSSSVRVFASKQPHLASSFLWISPSVPLRRWLHLILRSIFTPRLGFSPAGVSFDGFVRSLEGCAAACLAFGFLTAHRNLVTMLLLSLTSRFDSDFHLVSVD
jgi:hypothetical protein